MVSRIISDDDLSNCILSKILFKRVVDSDMIIL
jgi:hypothetical protein